jgi:uncharacterized protein (UPF0332 family)
MKKPGFLTSLKNEGKLELVEPSEEICASYLEKAESSRKSAEVLLPHKLYENSVSSSYYAMYNALTALFYKTGIKCENHSAAIILLRNLFGREELYKSISKAKEERIDKQYYVSTVKLDEETKESAEKMLKEAERFLMEIKLIIRKMNASDIKDNRKRFESIT